MEEDKLPTEVLTFLLFNYVKNISNNREKILYIFVVAQCKYEDYSPILQEFKNDGSIVVYLAAGPDEKSVLSQKEASQGANLPPRNTAPHQQDSHKSRQSYKVLKPHSRCIRHAVCRGS